MGSIITLAAARRSAPDWIIVGIYLLILLVSGIWFARREPEGAGEYFLANRRMPSWAVSFSVIASALSVATFIGVPEQVYKGNMTFLSTSIGSIIAVAVVAAFFIPAYYKYNVTTVYGLLERRFGPGAKQAASATFMAGRMFASGARVYIGAIPLAMVLFGADAAEQSGYLLGAIAILTAVAILYTLIGGIASVIYTDVLQTLVLVGAAVGAVIVLLVKIDLPLEQVWSMLGQQDPNGNSKTTVLLLGLKQHQANLGFNPSQTYTLLTAVFGFSLLNMAAYGTDHDLAQRMLTCKSAVRGSRSAWIAILMNLPITMVFMAIGALLWVYYRQVFAADPTAVVPKGERVFPYFIMTAMPAGLAGLMLAGLFAAGLGSLNSAINAMAATFVSDFYIPRTANRKGDRHYLSVSRLATVGWGIAIATFAAVCIYWKQANPQTTLIDFALQVMTLAYAGLLAVFLTAIFTRRGNTASAIAALVVGFVVALTFQSWSTWTSWFDATRALPDAGDGWALGNFKLAYPWHMLIATTTAFVVCCSGRPAEVRAAAVMPQPAAAA
jgi:solute:Na+ symporter, SSS family